MLTDLGVIHGDIQPQNLVVFQDSDGGFHAKLADFGHSFLFTNEEQMIHLPSSDQWTSLEYHHRWFGIL